VVPILDPFGETWLVAVTVQGECAVVEVQSRTILTMSFCSHILAFPVEMLMKHLM
jgi:hypothetical protein